jgi:hypothetical protein
MMPRCPVSAQASLDLSRSLSSLPEGFSPSCHVSIPASRRAHKSEIPAPTPRETTLARPSITPPRPLPLGSSAFPPLHWTLLQCSPHRCTHRVSACPRIGSPACSFPCDQDTPWQTPVYDGQPPVGLFAPAASAACPSPPAAEPRPPPPVVVLSARCSPARGVVVWG